jgi:hypothetical protein
MLLLIVGKSASVPSTVMLAVISSPGLDAELCWNVYVVAWAGAHKASAGSAARRRRRIVILSRLVVVV